MSRLRLAFVLLAVICSHTWRAAAADQNGATNEFPSPADVLEGRRFHSDYERDVFFLQAIHDRYASQWPALLAVNITPDEYAHSTAKLLRFVNALGDAMKGRDDPVACTNLAAIIGDPSFNANTNGYYPDIQRAAAHALIGIGPTGRKTLAAAFTENHYRSDPESLEELARVIGEDRPVDPEFTNALAAMAFDFTTAGGGIYPRCTTAAVTNLLCLPDGPAAVSARLKTESAFDNPGRFQAITEGIAIARTAELSTNLAALDARVKAQLLTLTNSPGAYRDDLQGLENRLQKAMSLLDKAGGKMN